MTDPALSPTADDWTSLAYVVVDVEGNGHRPPDLVELAAVPITAGAVGEAASWLVKPPNPVKHHATRIHGLTNADLADRPPFQAVEAEVLAALDHPAIVAHNAHVDLDVLRRTLRGWEPPEVFDTLKLARRLLPGRDTYRLAALVDAFDLAAGLPANLSPHRATYDAIVTARLFTHLARRTNGLDELRGGTKAAGDVQSLF